MIIYNNTLYNNILKNNNKNINKYKIFLYLFKHYSFNHLYRYFKILEKKLKYQFLKKNILYILKSNKILNYKQFKFLFIYIIFNQLKQNFNFFNLIRNLKNFTNKNINNSLIINDIYDLYKGSVFPFYRSKFSWFVFNGLKNEENLFIIIF